MARPKNERAKCLSRIQICTEGKTEALYLTALSKKLGIDQRVLLCKDGCGRKHESMVQQTQQCMRNSNASEVWLVYDLDEAARDEKSFTSFCKAFRLAKDAGYHVIVNVPCFEYWLLLHLQDCQANWTWEVCEQRFKEEVNKLRKQRALSLYSKEEHKSDPDLFVLLGGIDGAHEAKKRAERLAQQRGYELQKLTTLTEDRARRLYQDIACPSTSMSVLLNRLERLAQEK